MSKRVFISYKREDRPVVEVLAQNLRKAGFSVWYDELIRTGDDWWNTICEQIEQCDVFIFAISQRALESKACKLERQYAKDLGRNKDDKSFAVVQVGDLVASPREYARQQYGDFRKSNARATIALELTTMIHRASIGTSNNPGVLKPEAPIPPLSEIEEMVYESSALTNQQEKYILDELQELIRQREYRNRARKLVSAIRAKPSQADIQRKCDDLLRLNPPVRRLPPVLLIAGVVVLLISIGIGYMLSNAARPTPTLIAASTTGYTNTPVLSPTHTNTVPTMAILPLPTEAVIPTRELSSTVSDTATQSDLSVEQYQTNIANETGTSIAKTHTITAQSWTSTNTLIPTLTNRQVAETMVFSNLTGTAMMWTAAPTSTPTPTLITTDVAVFPTIYKRLIKRGVSFVYVPPGCFRMGSKPDTTPTPNTDEQPVRRVCLTSSYYISEFEVTNKQFNDYVTTTGVVIKQSDDCKEYSGQADQPVVCVRWDQAVAYATWMGCALPTEAQWEYAARGNSSVVYPWGNTYRVDRANVDDSNVAGGKFLRKAAQVGSYPNGASWIGAQDMIGNVWEWTADWYAEDFYATRRIPDNDPTGPSDGGSRSIRGGSWIDSSDYVRAALRDLVDPSGRSAFVGLRLVCTEQNIIEITSAAPSPTPGGGTPFSRASTIGRDGDRVHRAHIGIREPTPQPPIHLVQRQ